MRLSPYALSLGSLLACGTNDATVDGGSNDGGLDGTADDAASDGYVAPSCPDAGGAPSGFFVSPTGAAMGDGSPNAPWDLATALGSSKPKPGDTIWVRGGTYKGSFTSTLAGTMQSPITVRGYPSERAILDGVTDPHVHVLTINGAYSIFRDLEITNSDPVRVITNTGSNPPDARGEGVGLFAPGIKLIDSIIHDTGQGVGNWSPSPDGEVYGCIIFYNGWDAPDRGHGHGIYAQNMTGKKYLRDNIIFRQFSYGVHGYTEGGAIDNFVVEGNIAFNSGEASKQSGFATNILVGGLKVAQTPTIKDNATYFPMGEGGNNLGYSAGCTDANVTNNTFVAANALSLVSPMGTTTMTGNLFFGKISGFMSSAYPSNTYTTTRPTGTTVIVRPNAYEKGRAHVAVYDWDGTDTVTVDLANVLAPGDPFEVRDAQDIFAPPIASGTYTGPIQIPMTHTAITPPVGNVPGAIVHTSKDFGAFVVRKTCM